MHNGMILFKKHVKKEILPEIFQQIQGSTDSELFFALWISMYYKLHEGGTLEEALQKACTWILPESLMNLVLFDRQTDVLYVYRGKNHSKEVPPIYITQEGISNFKTKEKYTILPKNTLFIRTKKKNLSKPMFL
jgi:hypothetical protein